MPSLLSLKICQRKKSHSAGKSPISSSRGIFINGLRFGITEKKELWKDIVAFFSASN